MSPYHREVIQFIRVFAFLIVVFNTYALAVIAILRFVIYKRAFTKLDKFILSLAFAGTICVGYGLLVEPYLLSVERVTIASRKIPASVQAPIRIVHISDIHSDPQVRLEEKIPDVVKDLKPDLILFTGDAINSETALPNFRNLVTRLSAFAPVYGVAGNGDVEYWSHLKPLQFDAMTTLNCQSKIVEVRGVRLWLGGMAVNSESCFAEVLAQAPVDIYSIFLFHYPDLFPQARDSEKIDLYLAGHTHGGQVRMPFYGALITFSKFDKKYESGHIREGTTDLYVNRGIGMEGQAPRVRFLARPEVTLIELTPEI